MLQHHQRRWRLCRAALREMKSELPKFLWVCGGSFHGYVSDSRKMRLWFPLTAYVSICLCLSLFHCLHLSPSYCLYLVIVFSNSSLFLYLCLLISRNTPKSQSVHVINTCLCVQLRTFIFTQLPLEPQKALYNFFSHNTWKQTLMCEIGGVPL